MAARAAQLAGALVAWGVQPGDRVGTPAWNGHRHLELFYAVSGIGAVLHTVNPRLSDDHVAYVIEHARVRLLFADAAFLPIIDRLRASLHYAGAVIALENGYEAFIAAHPPEFD